jgi:hypothetical protein
MPYLSRPSCGLTVFTVIGHAHAAEECPRCRAAIDQGRRPFAPGPGTDEPRNRAFHKWRVPKAPEEAGWARSF